MEWLHILKGARQGERVALDKDTLVLGRSPDCQVVIPVTSVSRQHARLVRAQEKWYLEDMQSRNGTFLNNQPVTTRTPLRHNDRIRICDFVATFHDQPVPPPAPIVPGPPVREEEGSSTTVHSRLNHNSDLFREIQSAEKLQIILAATNSLRGTLEIDQLLPKVATSMFQLFAQADRCFIITPEEGSEELIPRVICARRPEDEHTAVFSRTIVRECLENAQAFLSDDATRDTRLAPSDSVAGMSIRSVICVPLCRGDGEPFGVIQVDTRDPGKKFTPDDLTLLMGAANQAAIALENAQLHEDLLAREQLELDLELAGQVQRSILPERLPQMPGYEFFAHYASALQVGGDYYDFIPLPQQRLAITIGDVAGKGMPAALLMAKLSADTRYCLLAESEPAAAISRLNDLVYRHTSRTDRFVTLMGAVLDPAAEAVTLVNAGHLAPLLYRRATGKLHEPIPAAAAGIPLGVHQAQVYTACQMPLQPGDSLLFFTDGVSDALSSRRQRFDVRGIHTAVQGSGPHSPKTLGQHIVDAVSRHAAGCEQRDDITLVSFGRIA